MELLGHLGACMLHLSETVKKFSTSGCAILYSQKGIRVPIGGGSPFLKEAGDTFGPQRSISSQVRRGRIHMETQQ